MERSSTALARKDDLPKYNREYYIAIAKGYPKRLEEMLKGYGWGREKLFAEAETIFPNEKFPGMSSEEKAATLLWQMENRTKNEFETTLSTVRKLLEGVLPKAWVDAIFDRFKQSV